MKMIKRGQDPQKQFRATYFFCQSNAKICRRKRMRAVRRYTSVGNGTQRSRALQNEASPAEYLVDDMEMVLRYEIVDGS